MKNILATLLVTSLTLTSTVPFSNVHAEAIKKIDNESSKLVEVIADEPKIEKVTEEVKTETEEVIKEIEAIEEVEEVPIDIPIEERIRLSCEEYGVPFDIVLAIARLETGWFESDAYIYGNNPGGLSENEVPMSFATIEEGVDRFVSNLANNYFYIGLTTPESIGQKYCPINPEWSVMVRELMSYGY